MDPALGIDGSVNEQMYAEARRLADFHNANQDTVASTPGGLSPSVYKVQIVELLSIGSSPSTNKDADREQLIV